MLHEPPGMFIGYNTNGFAHHRLDDAVEILADLGYRGIAITPDVHHLDPHSPDQTRQVERLARRLRDRQMKCVVETGARFLLDPRRKHQPTLLSATEPERRKRLDFLCHCIGLAKQLDADCVSFWSGTSSDNTEPDVLMRRLADGCQQLADLAFKHGLKLAFEPEPGMFVDTMDQFEALHRLVDRPNFGLTLDVGHLICQGEIPASAHILRWQKWLWNLHIEDMRAGVHDHMRFGEGEVDFDDVFSALRSVKYSGGLYVELSRHSHDAVNTARHSLDFLMKHLPSDASCLA